MKITEAFSILGAEYEKMTISGNLASTSKESICYRYSKYYDSQKVWWTTEYPERLDDVDYLIIALERKGILKLPPQIIKNYWETYNVGCVKNGRRKIRIKEENGKVVLYNNSDQPPIIIEDYIISRFWSEWLTI